MIGKEGRKDSVGSRASGALKSMRSSASEGAHKALSATRDTLKARAGQAWDAIKAAGDLAKTKTISFKQFSYIFINKIQPHLKDQKNGTITFEEFPVLLSAYEYYRYEANNKSTMQDIELGPKIKVEKTTSHLSDSASSSSDSDGSDDGRL